jgi:hypothetical protein
VGEHVTVGIGELKRDGLISRTVTPASPCAWTTS